METEYVIYRYRDGARLGTLRMDERAFGAYLEAAQQPQGITDLSTLGSIMAQGLPDEYDQYPGDTSVYVSEA